jgi:TetR/AcrR family transcriptional regulator, transcriptional repressor for nem operon
LGDRLRHELHHGGQRLDWVEEQFHQLGQPDAADLAITLLAGYQGMSLLANALRDSDIMTREGGRLIRWLDTLTRTSA